jgi:hypothetical protein
MKYLPAILLLLTIISIYSPTKRLYLGLNPDDYAPNINNSLKNYLVEIQYCDGRPPDTVLFSYTIAPTSGDILYMNREVMHKNYDIPVIHNKSESYPDVKQFINPCRITTLRKGQYRQSLVDSLYQVENIKN